MTTRAERADDAGLTAIAVRLRAVTQHAESGGPDAAAGAWLDAGLRIALVREIVHG